MGERARILKMDVDFVGVQGAVCRVDDLINEKRGASVCLSNVHMCMEVFDSPEFQSVVNGSDLVFPDGKPIYLAQKLLKLKDASQVRGYDLMSDICRTSYDKKISIGLYGGASDEVLINVVRCLREKYPNIRIVYSYSPPFRDLNFDEDEKVVRDINEAKVDVLFVGIGCPKQEIWMANHRDKLSCVMIGVGAAFDFVAGSKRHAPKWMQECGMEWFFRLICEPRRLWKRYFIQNPRFVLYFFCQYMLGKKY